MRINQLSMPSIKIPPFINKMHPLKSAPNLKFKLTLKLNVNIKTKKNVGVT